MTEPDETRSPEQILADADAAIAEAETRAAEIEDAVQQGDPTVTLEDYEAAERQSKWARLRRAVAERKAEARREQLQRAEYERIVRDVLPAATVDLSAEAETLIAEAQTVLRKLIRLSTRRNAALVKAAQYGADPTTFKGDEGELYGYMQAPSAQMRVTYATAEVTFEGRGYRYEPASTLVARALAPLRGEIRTASGGMAPGWVDEL